MIMASMRNWLHGGPLEAGTPAQPDSSTSPPPPEAGDADDKALGAGKRGGRVVVVHCKAGKGRSGTATCSYLISEQGWKVDDALARFTERRMRPRFGAGVSIPSQLRWISYVDRWTQAGKRYVDRAIEILEVHVWGLRNGVKVDVEGFVDNGRKIRVFHTFNKQERVVVEGDAPAGGGLGSLMWEWAGYPAPAAAKAPEGDGLVDGAGADASETPAAGVIAPDRPDSAPPGEKKHQMLRRKGTDLIQKVTAPESRPGLDLRKSKTIVESSKSAATSTSDVRTEPSDDAEPGGMAVILKPTEPIRIPTSDVNISVERRNKTPKSMGLTMVTAVAHVWFNAFFDGQGPEQGGKANDSGVFSIEWDAMDGIKGSSRKGARALDRLAVVWRAVGEGAAPGAAAGEEIVEPPEGQPVPQLQAADWAGGNQEGPEAEPDLGLRVQSPASADVSRASSLRSAEGAASPPQKGDEDDGSSLVGVRCSGPAGEELLDGAKKE